MSEYEIDDENDVQENKVIAALSYLGLFINSDLIYNRSDFPHP